MLGPLGLPAFPTWLHLPTLRNLRLRSPALLSWGTGQSSHYRVRREEAGRPQRSRDTGGQPAPWAACLGPLDLSHLAQALMKEQKRGRGEREGEGEGEGGGGEEGGEGKRGRDGRGQLQQARVGGPHGKKWVWTQTAAPLGRRTKHQKVQTSGWGRAGWGSRGGVLGWVPYGWSSLSWPLLCS